MKRTSLFSAIAATLREEVARGLYPPGAKLPSEAVLSKRFGVNRHTVRRALAELTGAGITVSRRGAGVFVTARATEYPIGRRVRFHRNLAAAGRLPGREILFLETREAEPAEAKALRLAAAAQVHIYEGVSFADGVPIAVFRSAFPAERFPGLPEALARTKSVTAALAEAGVDDYTRTSTRLHARRASATQARHLNSREGSPLLLSEAINIDGAGRPIEYGLTWFEGERVSLTVAPE
jgi:GntR family phosphonate transport system transcriptional regulator